MKFLYTLIFIISINSLAHAQESNKTISESNVKKAVAAWEKQTGSPINRWYSFYNSVDQLLGNPFTGSTNLTSVLPIWHDPGLLLRRGRSGYVDFLSVSQIVDPSSAIFNSDTDFINSTYHQASGAANMLYVSNKDSYFVDSIAVSGIYLKVNPLRTKLDSLIISLTPNKISYKYFSIPWISNYTSADTLYGYAPKTIDSINRAAYSDNHAYPGITWKVPLAPAMANTLRVFRFAPPGGPLAIPAGYYAAVTVTFKSSDTFVKGVDSIDEYDRFMPLFGYENAMPGGYITYMKELYHNDCNGAGFMYANDTSHYIPVIADQGSHLPALKFDYYEYVDIDALISCNTCNSVKYYTGTKNVSSLANPISVYPNPTSNELCIPVNLFHTATVSVSVSDINGKLIERKNMGAILNGNAVFNTAVYMPGVYFYIIQIDNEQVSGKFVVKH